MCEGGSVQGRAEGGRMCVCAMVGRKRVCYCSWHSGSVCVLNSGVRAYHASCPATALKGAEADLLDCAGQ